MGFFEDDATGAGTNAGDTVKGLDSALLHDALVAVTRRGWLMSVGGSRDGYSASLSLFGDGKQLARKYYVDVESMETALSEVLTAAEAPPEGKPVKRSRKPSGGR